MFQEFPKAVYLLGVYAEAANEAELEALHAQGFSDWSIDMNRESVAETQQSGENATKQKRPYNRKPKVEE
jgi:hypothetical protein